MQIPKPTETDKEFFRALSPDGAEIKPMFGNLGGFVNGNMFMGLFGADVGVRLDPAAKTELEAIAGSGAFGPEDRPMRDYVALPRAWRTDPDVAATWVQRAFEFVAHMPPKAKKKKKA